MSVRRLWIIVCALTLALGLAACGDHHPHLSGTSGNEHNAANANNNGGYVDAGPITYQLQISRELNLYSAEDSAYVKGLPIGTAAPTASQLWYGVFLWAKNQTGRPQTTSDNFMIQDTQGNTYYPIKLNPEINPLAWTAQTLEPLNTEPAPDTLMSEDSTQGGLVLFKVSSSVFANRPLIFYILSPAGRKIGSISLDL
ncbi:MAG: hypothetical protein WAK93_02140 [Solirubrobacteraceae bacterium]